MAVFVDLEDEDVDSPQPLLDVAKVAAVNEATASIGNGSTTGKQREEAHELVVRENPNRNSMTRALGCYP